MDIEKDKRGKKKLYLRSLMKDGLCLLRLSTPTPHPKDTKTCNAMVVVSVPKTKKEKRSMIW
jgi:hypothetical protein